MALPSKHLGLLRYPANTSVKTVLFNFTVFVSLNVNFQNFIKKKKKTLRKASGGCSRQPSGS